MVYQSLGLRSWLFPPTCLLCGDRGADGLDLCAGCLGDLPRNLNPCPSCALPLPLGEAGLCGRCQRRPPPYDRCLAPFLYAGSVGALVTRLKFGGRLECGRLLGELFVGQVGREAPPGGWPEAILPAPLHPARLRERGYNQAMELARHIAPALGIPILPHALRRVRSTRAQSGLDARARRRNLRGAFALDRPLGEAHVAILDDVVTTGSTAAACAEVLAAAGVPRVEVWAMARTPLSAGRSMLS